jgi:predicted dehydrogenase
MHLVRYVCGEVQAVTGTVRTFEKTRALRDDSGLVLESVDADVDDTSLATAHLANNAIAQLMWSWATHGEETNIPGAPIFYGSKGCLKGGQVILDDGSRTPAADLFEAQLSDADRERFFPLGLRDPYAIQQLDWLQAIEKGGQPETDGNEGLRDLAASFAMIESSALGRTVTLDEVLSGAVNTYQQEIDDHYGL